MDLENWKKSLETLLPIGKAWTFDQDSDFLKTLYSFAPELARVSRSAKELIEEVDPRTTGELLTAWERLLGLPDNCQRVLSDSVQARRQDVLTRLTLVGGSTINYFRSLARSRGFNVQFIEEGLALCGKTLCGQNMNGSDDWAYTITMIIDDSIAILFQAGISQAGESLGSYNPARIECLINAIKPAHIYLFSSFQDTFAYCGTAVCGDPIREIF